MYDKKDLPEELHPQSQWSEISQQINCGEGVTLAELKRRESQVLQNRAWMRVNGILIEGEGECDNGFTANHI